MPRSYGGDRVRALHSGAFEIVSSIPKGWRARTERTLTTAEFPGMAIHWDGEIYEVVAAEESAIGRCTYSLRPWAAHHEIRVRLDYSQASERDRASAFARAKARQRHATALTLSGLLIGHLPGYVQLEIESEYGIPAVRMTLLSVVPMVAFAAFCGTGLPIDGLPGPKLPAWLLALGGYALLDSLVRTFLCLLRRAPYGSLPGLIAWETWRTFTRRGREFERRAATKSESALRASSTRPPSDFEVERDAYVMRETYLALLSPDEQRRLHETFGFDPVKWGYLTAGTITAIAVFGLFYSAYSISIGMGSAGKWASVVVAGLLLVEQFTRLSRIRSGEPAGSVLGALVRPWCRGILSTKPRALAEGSIEPAERKLPDVWEGDAPEE